MTNETIVFNERFRLMESGIIGTTGNLIIIEDESGEKREVPEPEEIHTYAGWKECGRQVKRGERAIADFPVWKCRNRKPKDGTEEEKEIMFMAKAFWFKEEQTKAITGMPGNHCKNQ